VNVIECVDVLTAGKSIRGCGVTRAGIVPVAAGTGKGGSDGELVGGLLGK
jgi:hypothetical protein